MFSTMQILGKTPLLIVEAYINCPYAVITTSACPVHKLINHHVRMLIITSPSRFIIPQDSSSLKIHHHSRFIIPQDSSSPMIHLSPWFIFHRHSSSLMIPLLEQFILSSWLCLLFAQKGSHILDTGEVNLSPSPFVGWRKLPIWWGGVPVSRIPAPLPLSS